MESIFYQKAFWILLSALWGSAIIVFKLVKAYAQKDIENLNENIKNLHKRTEQNEKDIRNIIIADKYK